MKISYRGFNVEARKAKKGEEDCIYYAVQRKQDNFEVMGGFCYEEYSVIDFLYHLKGLVDDFIEDPQAYSKVKIETTVSDLNEEDEFYGEIIPEEDLGE